MSKVGKSLLNAFDELADITDNKAAKEMINNKKRVTTLHDLEKRMGKVAFDVTFTEVSKELNSTMANGRAINDSYSVEYWYPFFKGVSNMLDNPVIIPFGKKDKGKKKWMMYENLCHNTIVFGSNVAGKTTFLKTVLWTIEHINNPHQIRLLLVDPRYITFTFNKQSKFLYCPVINSRDEYIEALDNLLNVIDKRNQILGQSNFEDYYKDHKEELPYILILIDDYYELFDPSREEEVKLQKILKQGKEVGIYVILSTLVIQDDYPLSRETISMFDNKVCMQNYDKEVMRFMVGRYQNLNGQGDMIVQFSEESKLTMDTCNHRMRLQGLRIKNKRCE